MVRPLLVVLALAGCGGEGAQERAVAGAPAPEGPTVRVTILGTNDVHGRVRSTAIFGGYVEIVRRAREADGGGVLVLDAGDVFQGTLESNMGEGATMVRAYDAIGYHAIAIGNHEFDYGPEGEPAIAAAPGDDPRGALKMRMRESRAPFLSATVIDEATGRTPRWPSFAASRMVHVAGVPIGIVGATTAETPDTTSPANFRGLRIDPLAERIAAEATRLRRAGAKVIVVTAHAGGRCTEHHDPRDLSSCAPDQEIFQVARVLPAGLVDVIVGGHTHEGVAHFVGGIAVIESFAHGRAFGRVDLTIDRQTQRVRDVQISPPREMCRGISDDLTRCDPGEYEGVAVVPHAGVIAAITPDLERAAAIEVQPLNVEVESPFEASRHRESALGNFFADVMRLARPDADVTVINGGALRESLPEGVLTYGQLYAAMPFDDRFATVQLTGAELEQLLVENLTGRHGILSLSGVRVRAHCARGELRLTIVKLDGEPVRDEDAVLMVTSDFLATGGDGLIDPARLPEGAVELDPGPLMRDGIAVALRNRGGNVRGDDPAFFDPGNRRILYPGSRPVVCRR